MEALRIQADAIIVSSEQIHRPGQIVVAHGEVIEQTSRCTERPDILLSGKMLAPALINAHTHLEFSDLQSPIAAGATFPQWIGSVIRHRRSLAESHSPEALEQLRRDALQRGLAESNQAGVAIVADIVTAPWLPSDYNATENAGAANSAQAKSNQQPATESHSIQVNPATALESIARHIESHTKVFAFPEVIGLDVQRCSDAVRWALEFNQRGTLPAPLLQLGVSPHAPYSIHFPTAITELAAHRSSIIAAMHIAESLEEREWLEKGTGPFQAVFEKLGVPSNAPRASIMDTIEWLASFQRALLIHGNYLTLNEIERVAESEISVVFCPRTHLHFGHSTYPLTAMTKAGVNVVLGTDSRASNPDLDIWNEVRTLRSTYREVSPQFAFAAVTQRAAEALGCQDRYGTLQVGKLAAINVADYDPIASQHNLLDELTLRANPFEPLHQYLSLAIR